MNLQEWKNWLALCKFYYLGTDQNFACSKAENRTAYRVIQLHKLKYFEILAALGSVITSNMSTDLDLLVHDATSNPNAPPLIGLYNFVGRVVLFGKTLHVQTYSPASEGYLKSKFFVPSVKTENIVQALPVPTHKKLEINSSFSMMDLASTDESYVNVPRLYMCAAFALLHNKTKLGGVWGDYNVAALLVAKNGEIISYGLNKSGTNRLFHAEVCCLYNYLVNSSTEIPDDSHLFVTLKPCLMCASFLAHYAKDVRGFKIYYAHTDPGANETCLERANIFVKKLGSNGGKPLKLVKKDFATGEMIKYSVSDHLDANIKTRIITSLRNYSWLYKNCNDLIIAKKAKYDSDSSTKPVAMALKQINDFLAFLQIDNFNSNWHDFLNIEWGEMDTDL
ncbi:Bd3614 family nucleic acid deaminase [Pseudomonas citri]|uniref:Bd3614 family nucleic acid deaminase n=1 Tax=Pseudomonas citri TaxID=2978349 RepID=UPI0021B4E9E1|nr:Bd3614 family nucleic acid deaminase [Pseudomonas citri]